MSTRTHGPCDVFSEKRYFPLTASDLTGYFWKRESRLLEKSADIVLQLRAKKIAMLTTTTVIWKRFCLLHVDH